MAVWDKNYRRTGDALDLENKVRSALCPVLDKAIEDGMELEDVFYIVSDTVQDWMLSTVLTKRDAVERGNSNG